MVTRDADGEEIITLGPCKALLPWAQWVACPNVAEGLLHGTPVCTECYDALTEDDHKHDDDLYG